jgi:hypothetical protein
MSHEGNEKLNEILGGLLTSYQGLQAMADVQRDEFMAEITDETGKIDLVKLTARTDRLRAERSAQEQQKHPYELNPVDFVNNPTHRADILAGLEGFLKLDYTQGHDPVAENPAEAAKSWIRQVLAWATCSKGYQEQIESFTSSTEETNIAEKLGRGLVKPEVTYDDDVNIIKRVQEVLDAALEGNDYHELKNAAETAREFVKDVLVMVTSVRHNTKPVLDLKKIVEIMRDWVEAESLASHVKFDMANMIESLDKIIAQHIGEDVPVAVDAQVTTESRTVHSLGAVMSAANDHPLDIDQTALKEVALWLNSIVANNPGFHNLGKEGYIIVPSSNNLPGNVVDSVRGYLISYGQGEHMASELRSQAAVRGDLSINHMPEWFATTWGHTSKGGFAALMYHTMTQVAAQEKPKTVHISSAELGKLEEAIRNDQPFALVDYIKSATKSDVK